jgi:lipopolysaccharide/colanic/teichoic acid biosynthesis glycosyltransferase
MRKKSEDYFNSSLKRGIDILGSIVGILVSLPLYIIIPPLIKLTSRGSVFYFQERMGKNKKNFHIIKFRTMVSEAEKEKPLWAEENDTRITNIGLFLRRTRMDEWPQFINVLKGEMSIVGPRPEREYFVNLLEKQIPLYNSRFILKPGITGWAQVNHKYASNLQDNKVKLYYDLIYLKKSSFFFDLIIVIKTIKSVLNMKGR